MLKLFLNNRSGVLGVLPLIIAVYSLTALVTGYQENTSEVQLGILGAYQLPSIISVLASILLISINAILLNFIFNQHEFFDRNIYLPALIYVVLMSYYKSFYTLNGILVAHTLLILSLYQLFHLRQNEDGRARVFNASVFFGLATVFHPPLILTSPLLLLMVSFIRPFKIQEYLLIIAGVSVAILYGGLFVFINQLPLDFQIIQATGQQRFHQLNFTITAGIFAFLFLLSLFGIRDRLTKTSIRLKKLVRILWVFMLIGLGLGVYGTLVNFQIERFSFLVLPLSFFLTYAFLVKGLQMLTRTLFYVAMIYGVVKFFV